MNKADVELNASIITSLAIDLPVNKRVTCCAHFVFACICDLLRTSDSLNEGLPIKMTREKFLKNDIFSMKKTVGSTLDVFTKAVFSLDKYQLKNMG